MTQTHVFEEFVSLAQARVADFRVSKADDGFSTLTPDEYLQLRLEPMAGSTEVPLKFH